MPGTSRLDRAIAGAIEENLEPEKEYGAAQWVTPKCMDKFLKFTDGKDTIAINLDLVAVVKIDPTGGRESVVIQFTGGLNSKIVGAPAKAVMHRFGVASTSGLEL